MTLSSSLHSAIAHTHIPNKFMDLLHSKLFVEQSSPKELVKQEGVEYRNPRNEITAFLPSSMYNICHSCLTF